MTVAAPPKVGPLGYWVGCFKKYAVFTGRARRAEYWWFTLVNLVLYAAMFGIGLFIENSTGDSVVTGVLFVVLLLAMILPSLAVSCRRLHDANLSGLWLLLSFVPFGGLVTFAMTVMEGTAGPNRYGPDPRRAG